MVQELITYLIVGAAVALAISKSIKKLKGKKKRREKANFKKDTYSMQHNCSDCSAECMLRDAAIPIKENNRDLCKKVDVRKVSE